MLLITVIMFILGFWSSKIVFKKLGSHPAFDVSQSLKLMSLNVGFASNIHGNHPSEKKINAILDYVWLQKGEAEDLKENYETGFLMDEFTTYTSTIDKVWGRPVYVVSDTIPDRDGDGFGGGRGFYVVGEDGISNSNGNDPDDINSWGKNSHVYYYKKESQSFQIRDFIFASVVSLIAIMLLVVSPKRG